MKIYLSTIVLTFCTVFINAQSISVSPNVSNAGESITVNFSGTSTNFTQGTGTSFWFSQGTSTIYGSPNITNDSLALVDFYLPNNSSLGNYDVNYLNDTDGLVQLPTAFLINAPIVRSISISPDSGYVGEEITVNFSGTNTRFSQGSNTSFWFSQGSNTISGSSSITNDTNTDVSFSLPSNAQTGFYDVHYYGDLDGTISISNGFKINPLNVEPLNISLNIIDATSNSLCNGSASLTISGGRSPYSIAYSNTDISLNSQNLCTGIYSVTVTDALNASSMLSFLIAAKDSSIFINTNVFSDSTIIISVENDPIKNCEISYQNIVSVNVITYRIIGDVTDSAEVDWLITYADNTTETITSTYNIYGEGVYQFYLTVYCDEKSQIYGHFKTTDFVDIKTIAGINKPLKETMKLYPNPNSGTIHLVLGNDLTLGGNISIYTIIGEEVFRNTNISNSSNTINFHGPKGLYIIKYTTVSGVSTTQKFIKH